MLEKKLITLACAIAILGIGACFLPPQRPPAILLPPNMAGTRVLAIDVRDASPTEPLPSSDLSNFTAGQFNQLWSTHHLRVVPWDGRATPDITLHITVLSKQATPVRATIPGLSMNVALRTRMELVHKKDGRRIWLRDEPPITFTFWRPAETQFSWQSLNLEQEVAYSLAKRVGAALHAPNPPTEQP